MTFVFPIACYFKAFGHENIEKREKIMCYGILCYGILGGLVSAYYALIALINGRR
jgi:hypothetical protein